MAYDHATIITHQANQLEAERLAAANDYEANRLNENEYGVLEAANRYVEIEAKIAALDRIAGNFAATTHRQQQQQQRNPCGLSRDEQEVARISGISDQQYSANKQRMQQMKDAGYWSQGKVFK